MQTRALDFVSRDITSSNRASLEMETLASPGSPCSPMRSRFSGEHDPLLKLLRKNRQWSSHKQAEDPEYFQRLLNQQHPEWLWIGCADSRVPANVILGLEPGEVFVQRNVGNQAAHTDLNCMSCLEYAVNALKVRNVIVCGHYGCGAVKAAIKMPSKTQNLVNCWISDIRDSRNQYRAELRQLPDLEQQCDRLCELNVLRQTFNVCTSPSVQAAWDNGQELHIYGVVYSLKDGLIKKLVGPISKNGDFEHDQADFLDSTLVKESATDPVASPAAPSRSQQGPGTPGTSSTSFKARMDAFNAYINTMAVSSRIAEHVGWTDDTAAADDPSASGANTLPAAASPRSGTAPTAAAAAVASGSPEPEAVRSCGGTDVGALGAADVGAAGVGSSPLSVVTRSEGGAA